MKRKPISKKRRFEIFKRDSFSCQYCGSSAPDVILHVDHISPVSKGGGDEIENLITSCIDCNYGKGARELDDSSVIKKQQAQLQELNERREQLEMMLKWRDEIQDISNQCIEKLSDIWSELCPGYFLNENGIKTVKSLYRKYGFQQVAVAMETSVDRYLELNKDGDPTKQSVEASYKKVSGICRIKAMPDHEQKLRYARGIIKNRTRSWDLDYILKLLRNAYDAGADIDDLTEKCKMVDDMDDFTSMIQNILESS